MNDLNQSTREQRLLQYLSVLPRYSSEAILIPEDALCDLLEQDELLTKVAEAATAVLESIGAFTPDGWLANTEEIVALRNALERLAPLPVEQIEPCPGCGGPGDDLDFDRSICSCGDMHYYCANCGRLADECPDL